MAEIQCFTYNNGNIKFVGVVDDFESFTFERSYSGIGEWQIVLNGYSQNVAHLKQADFIRCGVGIAGLICKDCTEKNETDNTITISGIELKGLAQKRIVMPPFDQSHLTATNQSPEHVIATILQTQITNAAATRQIIGSVAPYVESTETITYNGRFSNVADDIVELCETHQIGWYADIESGEIIWHIYHGIDRKADQTENNRLIVSYDYDSMAGSNYERARHSVNAAVVAGQGEGVDRAISVVGNSKIGLDRTEVYIDARDIEDDALLPQRGAAKLAEYGNDIIFEGVPNTGYFLRQYRKTFDLGDIGTLKEEGINFRLTTIKEIYENGQFTLSFGFGYDAATLTASLKRMATATMPLINTENYGSEVTYPISIENGGTGATTPSAARTNLDAAQSTHAHTVNDITDMNNPNREIVGGDAHFYGAVAVEGAVMAQIGHTLYDKYPGTESTVTLSDSAANYEFLDIMFHTGDDTPPCNTVRVYDPDGKRVSLLTAQGGNYLYLKHTVVDISGNAITYVPGESGEHVVRPNASTIGGGGYSNLRICKVVGYKLAVG